MCVYIVYMFICVTCLWRVSCDDSLMNTVPIHECDGIDIRNDCMNLLHLNGCSVIKGSLTIALLDDMSDVTDELCNYSNFSFPALREITDYLLFHNVKGLISIRNLFPNLTVIRGRRLFINYALGITRMPDLESIEFKSLLAIQRGHIFINSSPKLCNLKKIDWDRLTLSRGENHIYPTATCTTTSECKGCHSDHCWSDLDCQKSENDNLVNLLKGSRHCHRECLGGCYNETQEGCFVCKRLTDHGRCVEQCPREKYLLEHYQRCYTKDECITSLQRYTFKSTCVSKCPSGFAADKNYNCVSCARRDDCSQNCNPKTDDVVPINNLGDTDSIKYCRIINGSLEISIKSRINEKYLAENFENLREIRGYLKIRRSPYITSLKFLQNLQKVWGQPLDNNLYALVIYDNRNLEDLWSPSSNFSLANGGMYMHLNNKMCNRHLKMFQSKVLHDKGYNSLQVSDQDVLCGESKLRVHVQYVSHKSLQLVWDKKGTLEEVEILYRQIPAGRFSEQSELDSNICTRINWKRKLLFRSELSANSTHYSYLIEGLTPNTKYGYLVKTFGDDNENDAHSDLRFVVTQLDVPFPPTITAANTTATSITVLLESFVTEQAVKYYMLNVYEESLCVHSLATRDYCRQPIFLSEDRHDAHYTNDANGMDYDSCCLEAPPGLKDSLFRRNMRKEFVCDIDHKENCLPDSKLLLGKPSRRIRLDVADTPFTLHQLRPFAQYIIQSQACNDLSCSAYSILVERTAVGEHDLRPVDSLAACHDSAANEYRVYFGEPLSSSCAIVAYLIHYRAYEPRRAAYKTHISCVTRLQHVQSKSVHISHYSTRFNEVALRTVSLAGNALSNWTNITSCEASKRFANTTPTTQSGGINVFLVCFLIGAGGALLWLCYKRRYWRKLYFLRRFVLTHFNWPTALPLRDAADDRQILVDSFDIVRFHNNPDDEPKNFEG